VYDLPNDTKVLLFVGRLSQEKGVMGIPDIYKDIKTHIPNLKVVFAGTGPAEDELKLLLPDALFMGWVESTNLPEIYSAADLLILPSRFDTFSLVVLEALSCGTPVIAYNSKGPKDIIEHESCGYLAKGKKDMKKYICKHFDESTNQEEISNKAIERASHYNKNDILDLLMIKVGL